MQQFIVITDGIGERKVEVCSTMENARRVATKWCGDLNCTVLVAKVVTSCVRVTEWNDPPQANPEGQPK